jgi:hypothetical protein
MDEILSNDPIDRWIHQPIPEKLWHYTSIQGFHGIISSRSIYATDVRFLNDAEEFVHARKIADDLVRQTPESGEFNFPLRWNLEWVTTEIFKSDFLDPNKAQIFVASFTDSEDDLSQWRAYSHGTYGMSISFDLRVFRPPVASDSAVTFAPCVYNDDAKRELIQHALDHFLKAGESWWIDAVQRFLKEYELARDKPTPDQIQNFTNAIFSSKEYKTQLRTGLEEARKRIVRLAGLLKHRAFHHEREWRLVLPMSPDKDKNNLVHPVCFRSTSASLIPYIAFPLQVLVASSGSGAQPLTLLPVNDVMLGPEASDDAVRAATEFLKSKSVGVTARKSTAPYRQV